MSFYTNTAFVTWTLPHACRTLRRNRRGQIYFLSALLSLCREQVHQLNCPSPSLFLLSFDHVSASITHTGFCECCQRLSCSE
jgi:hypothetical protein